MFKQTKFDLPQSKLPTAWYNIQADLPVPLPPQYNPVTKELLAPADLEPLFARKLIEQEVSKERYIDIPGEVLDKYKLWRPTTLHRALALEEYLGTPARIYYKYEGMNAAGSHKPNSAIPQVYYNKKEGISRLTTETGAGQWGSSLAMACAFFGLECKVYMVAASYKQKPHRKTMMETWGAQCVSSPSQDTQIGRNILATDPDCGGSLGLAISEALEDALNRNDTHYTLGSVLNHVILHQSIIGLESMEQLKIAGEEGADIVIGCAGGGSNLGGICVPYVKQKLEGRNIRIIAVEPAAAPSLTKGKYTYDYGDVAGLTPIMKMYTLGHTFMPAPVHAGGLRFHGMAPIISHLRHLDLIEALAVNQNNTFKAGVIFAGTEGIISAPESMHAIHAAIEEANKCKESKEEKVILFNLSGHGHFDMSAYQQYLNGSLEKYEYSCDEVEKSLQELPLVKE
ncbi:MAG: TrpB-like pyridoxal phosphate-dependent enzyme [Chloroflexi bacterium]|nr:TrpB-like pyridoxal phosphate-dependent enzyme [Chloroflexota bacterium]